MDTTKINLQINVTNSKPFVLKDVSIQSTPNSLIDQIANECVKLKYIHENHKKSIRKVKYSAEQNHKVLRKVLLRTDKEKKEETIASLNITKDTVLTIDLTMNIEQQAFTGMNLLDLKDLKTDKFSLSETAPKYRTAWNGLNMEGVCKNKDCLAFGQLVINQLNLDGQKKGYGTVDIVTYMCNEGFVCPECNKSIFPVLNFYFMMCKFKWIAKIYNEETGMETCTNEGEATDPYDVVAFIQSLSKQKEISCQSYKFIIEELKKA
jgi:hypothetical protein